MASNIPRHPLAITCLLLIWLTLPLACSPEAARNPSPNLSAACADVIVVTEGRHFLKMSTVTTQNAERINQCLTQLGIDNLRITNASAMLHSNATTSVRSAAPDKSVE